LAPVQIRGPRHPGVVEDRNERAAEALVRKRIREIEEGTSAPSRRPPYDRLALASRDPDAGQPRTSPNGSARERAASIRLEVLELQKALKRLPRGSRACGGALVSGEKPLSEYTDAELVAGAKMGSQDPILESMRRLRVAVEKQSSASGRLTWAIIALMLVQIVVAIVKVGS
jgi:hypothetical protein